MKEICQSFKPIDIFNTVYSGIHRGSRMVVAKKINMDNKENEYKYYTRILMYYCLAYDTALIVPLREYARYMFDIIRRKIIYDANKVSIYINHDIIDKFISIATYDKSSYSKISEMERSIADAYWDVIKSHTPNYMSIVFRWRALALQYQNTVQLPDLYERLIK
jgi:hypothetical protein